MDYSKWTAALGDSTNQLIQRFTGYLPNLLGAITLLLLGWLLARLLRAALGRLTHTGVAGLARNRAIERAVEGTGLRERIPRVVSLGTYWVVLLFFVAAAIERLELPIVTTLVSSLAYYLPKVLIGVLIVFAGFVAGNIACGAVITAATTARISYAGALGRTAQIVILFVAFVIGAEYVGLNSTFLTVIASIVTGAVLGGAALAFGLGSGPAISNIISSHYLLKTYQIGQMVRIGAVQGRIVEITQMGVILDSPEGRIMVPARKFSEEASVLLAGEN